MFVFPHIQFYKMNGKDYRIMRKRNNPTRSAMNKSDQATRITRPIGDTMILCGKAPLMISFDTTVEFGEYNATQYL